MSMSLRSSIISSILINFFLASVNISASSNIRSRYIKSDETHQNENKRKLTILNDEVTTFKARYNNRESSFQEVEFFSDDNTMSIEGQMYSLENLEELEVLTPDAIILKDGKEVDDFEADTLLFRGNDGDTQIFVSHNGERRINVIEIYNGENYTSLVSDFSSDDDELSHQYDPLSMNSIDFDEEVMFDFKDNFTDPMPESVSDVDTIFTMQSSCSYYRVIEVAVAFDTSFCNFVGGFNAAVNRAKLLVGLASNKYNQPGLCLRLHMSAADGRCNYNDDPYAKMAYWKSGCVSKPGFLDDFMDYWSTYMKYIPRDTAHLFTAQQMDGPVGCSGIGSICRNAYGVNQMSYFYDSNLQGVLLAHEIGHNLGAGAHVGGTGYVMNQNVNGAQYGFSSQSIYAMTATLNSANCLSYGK